jgi:hypothetical protein
MSTFDDGGPAFPQAMNGDKQPVAIDFPSMGGMSLRDYFAAKAMTFFVTQNNPKDCARYSYEFADAMLAARAKAQA